MTSKEQGARSREQVKPTQRARVVSVGRQAEFTVIAACLLLLVLSPTTLAHAAFSFDDIEFWVGAGANRSALVIDWIDDAADPPALAWGFRWDGAAKGRDLITAVVAADPRLFAKLGGSAASANAVYGFGYDTDGDGVFGLDDETAFDAAGIAFSGPADLAAATDPGDLYAEGWFTGFWHYGTAAANPYDGGSWSDAPAGMAGRDLVDGSWDSWVFTPTFDFTAFAENPVAAPPPNRPGDFNFDGTVDVADYTVWASAFGSITQLAADGNGNGAVDAADYVIWRERFAAASASRLSPASADVPEPASAATWLGVLIYFLLTHRFRSWPQISQICADCRKVHLRESAKSAATIFVP
jgi:hypothetical protein